ncbi:MAG: ATP-binding cassette domain-containing protein [Gammaproteobacteria bacterium]|nr:ATP-binding cassette domain-containing protein [Gammaproteobacteria bacterium]
MTSILERVPSRVRSLLSLPVLRPVAISMLFLAMVILGTIGISRMPVELVPSFEGNVITVRFARPGSTDEVVEREILLPLMSRISGLGGVIDDHATISRSLGSLTLVFHPLTNMKVRERQVKDIASILVRQQPKNSTYINVGNSAGNGQLGAAGNRTVMQLLVTSEGLHSDAIYDIASDRIEPRLASVPGVATAQLQGGGGRQVNIFVDPDAAVALGISLGDVRGAIANSLGQVASVGTLDSGNGRTNVMVDGQVDSINHIRNARVDPARGVTVTHISTIELGYALGETRLRYNGNPAIRLQVFQEPGSNLVKVGKALEKRIEEVRREIQHFGLGLEILNNQAEIIDNQIDRVYKLGFIGLAIALVVLFLFLRRWRAVLVVGISVPVSVTFALAGLYLLGQTVNLLTLFGLTMAIGLLVDNSVVVYESILRGLERGLSTVQATRIGLRKTVRAIVAASVTTTIVFLPIFIVGLEDPILQQQVETLAIAVILPIIASMLVAVGLVPLLAHKLAAPAAFKRIQQRREVRKLRGGFRTPEPMKILLSGFAAKAIRHPASWIAGTIILVLATLVSTLAFNLVAVGGLAREAEQANNIFVPIRVHENKRAELDQIEQHIQVIEEILLDTAGVESIQSSVNVQRVSLDIAFVDINDRPDDFRASEFRPLVDRIIQEKNMTDVFDLVGVYRGYRGGWSGQGYYGGSWFRGTPKEVIVSGPDPKLLYEVAHDISTRLREHPRVQSAEVPITRSSPELWIEPNRRALEAFGLTLQQAMSFVDLSGRGSGSTQINFPLSNGREIPIYIELESARDRNVALRELREMHVQTPNGALPVTELASIRQGTPPATITYRKGRRELPVNYSLDDDVPDSGPERVAIEENVKEFIRQIPLPAGYVVDTPSEGEQFSYAKKLVLPVLGLLFLVLAFTFESLAVPVLIFLAIPLVIVGSLWGLILTGTPFEFFAYLGFFVLAGLSINPSILLLDRMQQFSRAGFTRGGAAFASVLERTRPVLMTTATTVAALFPLAITTGRENEMWPPFAIVVMGGLVSSAILTLIIIPVGYVFLKRLDETFGRLGAWLMIGWMTLTIGTVFVFVEFAGLKAFFWQIVCSVLIGGFYLGLIVLIFRRVELPEPEARDGPPKLVVTYLRKIYGLPGAIRRALNSRKEFVAKVLEAKGTIFTRAETLERTMVLLILAFGFSAIGWINNAGGWKLMFWLAASAFLALICVEIRKFRGYVTPEGVHVRGGIEGFFKILLPWIAVLSFCYLEIVNPVYLNDEPARTNWFWPIVFSTLLLFGQMVRRNALQQSTGKIAPRVTRGFLKYPRTWYRRMTLKLGGLDLPGKEIHALSSVSFTATKGMIGILGPNGAGKTTLLRQLAGILDPTRGNVRYGGVSLGPIRNVLARWVGYLPQDAGLPRNLSSREYLAYYAALYEIPPEERAERVRTLLKEVGLGDKIDEKIGSLSGGMRQRVAVARTLLRLPSIIIVDEPTVGLDPRERIRFRNLLSRLAASRIVLFSTHVVEDVAISCDRVLVIAKSRLRFDGSPTDLAQQATDKVWEVELEPGASFELPTGATLAEESPTPAGGKLQRIVAAVSPSERAKSIGPRPEDGYLWLLAQAET